MAAPALILQYPYYMLTAGTGSVANGSSDGSGMNFGEIVLKNDISDAYEVGDNVSYLTQGQILVSYDNVQYAIVKDESIKKRPHK